MRILAVDPGEKRLGIAISDPLEMIANPLQIIEHVSRPIDAATIVALAAEYNAGKIIIGQALDEDGQQTPQSRLASRLVEAVRQQTSLPVELWDESGSTQAARSAHIAIGGSAHRRRKRGHGHLDDLAATFILQTYLDANA